MQAPKLPRSPDAARLRRLSPSLFTLRADTSLYRVYRRGGSHPAAWNQFRAFGPTSARFDHHLPDSSGNPCQQDRGILYLACDLQTALAEAFQDTRAVDRTGGQPGLAQLQTVSDLSLLDLTGNFCIRAGGSMKLMSGERGVARNWSQGFYAAYSSIHGLYYPSSLTNQPVVALYERALAQNPFPKSPALDLPLSASELARALLAAATAIGYDLV